MAILVTGLRTFFVALFCLSSATVIYTVCTDGLPFRKELLTPWMAATLVDFYINIFALALWIIYKEANFVSSVVWIILLVCFGSITACAYIFIQLLKLSPQETAQDPMYHVLLRHENKNQEEQKGKYSQVVAGRIIFTILGCVMISTLIYTIVTDGSPFRTELLTPWMSATLIDFYVNVVALSVWVAYKETSWFSASMWIVLLICFGSATTCAYIAVQLFQLSSQDPVYLVLLRRNNRYDVRVLMFLFAFTIYSVASCGYVFIQLLKLSPQASAQDPVYHVLLRPEHKWMAALLIDLHGNVLVLSVWVAYKETSWLSASVWIVLLICPGGVATCAFISKQLFQLSSQDPIYLLLLKNNGRATKVPLLSSV
ncbi:unnamed protein product [Linum tenue]|uniref:XK-related protein n=1 Tax=Linum tenue TaxID=586396 RepID=A0AAV0IHY8_9ROSI|nr:unnamed protein product [Linum tenue]